MTKQRSLIFYFLILFSSSANAEVFCLATNSINHCNAGDIVLVTPTKVPLVCDFGGMIIKMAEKETGDEYVCRYTGNTLQIRQAQVQKKESKLMKPIQLPPPQVIQPKPKKNNWMPFWD